MSHIRNEAVRSFVKPVLELTPVQAMHPLIASQEPVTDGDCENLTNDHKFAKQCAFTKNLAGFSWHLDIVAGSGAFYDIVRTQKVVVVNILLNEKTLARMATGWTQKC
jgi:hypothetical protein